MLGDDRRPPDGDTSPGSGWSQRLARHADPSEERRRRRKSAASVATLRSTGRKLGRYGVVVQTLSTSCPTRIVPPGPSFHA